MDEVRHAPGGRGRRHFVGALARTGVRAVLVLLTVVAALPVAAPAPVASAA